MNDDFTDLLELLLGAGARFLVVGAHAMAVHGVPRATGDLDVWIDREPANASKVWDALKRFGAPVEQLGLTRAHLETPGNVAQIGVPPRRIDLLTSITGVEFDEAWRSRVVQKVRDLEVPFLGRADLIKNKRALGRRKDQADLESLGEEP
jgi:hypothetical protein